MDSLQTFCSNNEVISRLPADPAFQAALSDILNSNIPALEKWTRFSILLEGYYDGIKNRIRIVESSINRAKELFQKKSVEDKVREKEQSLQRKLNDDELRSLLKTVLHEQFSLTDDATKVDFLTKANDFINKILEEPSQQPLNQEQKRQRDQVERLQTQLRDLFAKRFDDITKLKILRANKDNLCWLKRRRWANHQGTPTNTFMCTYRNEIKLTTEIFSRPITADSLALRACPWSFYERARNSLLPDTLNYVLVDVTQPRKAPMSGKADEEFHETHADNGGFTVLQPNPLFNGLVDEAKVLKELYEEARLKSQSEKTAEDVRKIRALVIGAAHGVEVMPFVKLGIHVVANDIDAWNLAEIGNRYEELFPWCTDLAGDKDNLTLAQGEFPYDLANYPDNHFDYVIASRVLHFLTGPELEAALSEIARVLKPGGKVYIVCETPYLANWIPLINEYRLRRDAGMEHPGEVHDPKAYESSGFAKKLPEFMHFMDKLYLETKLKMTHKFSSVYFRYVNQKGVLADAVTDPEKIKMPLDGATAPVLTTTECKDGRHSVRGVCMKRKLDELLNTFSDEEDEKSYSNLGSIMSGAVKADISEQKKDRSSQAAMTKRLRAEAAADASIAQQKGFSPPLARRGSIDAGARQAQGLPGSSSRRGSVDYYVSTFLANATKGTNSNSGSRRGSIDNGSGSPRKPTATASNLPTPPARVEPPGQPILAMATPSLFVPPVQQVFVTTGGERFVNSRHGVNSSARFNFVNPSFPENGMPVTGVDTAPVKPDIEKSSESSIVPLPLPPIAAITVAIDHRIGQPDGSRASESLSPQTRPN